MSEFDETDRGYPKAIGGRRRRMSGMESIRQALQTTYLLAVYSVTWLQLEFYRFILFLQDKIGKE
jgi:hypothetical protein